MSDGACYVEAARCYSNHAPYTTFGQALIDGLAVYLVMWMIVGVCVSLRWLIVRVVMGRRIA